MYDSIFPIIRKQTIGPPNYDGLLQVNWNHPVASGLAVLVPAFGNHFQNPVNLVTGETGDFTHGSATGKWTPMITAWGLASGGLDTAFERVTFQLNPVINSTDGFSFGSIALRQADYASAQDTVIRLSNNVDAGENASFVAVNGYSSDVPNMNVQHDYGSVAALSGETPAEDIGDIFSVVGTAYRSTDWYLKLGQASFNHGYRPTIGSADAGADWDTNINMAYIHSDVTGFTGVFLYMLWSRVLSEEEIEITTNPQYMWDLFKPLPKHFYFPEAIDEGFGVSVPIIQRQTIATPPDGLLQVNWNHPVSNGLTLLVPAYGKMAKTPVNLVTGEVGNFISGTPEKILIKSSAWGDGHAGCVSGNTEAQAEFNLPRGSQKISAGVIATRLVDYASDRDQSIRILDIADSGENFQFSPVSGFVGDSTSVTAQHDYAAGHGMTGASPASPVGDIISAVGAIEHDGGIWYNTIGETCLTHGYRYTSGDDTAGVWTSDLQTARVHVALTGYTAVFAYYMWDRILSSEEMEMVTDLQYMWDLFKPLPKHFYFPGAEPASGLLPSIRTIGRGIMRGIGRGVG